MYFHIGFRTYFDRARGGQSLGDVLQLACFVANALAQDKVWHLAKVSAMGCHDLVDFTSNYERDVKKIITIPGCRALKKKFQVSHNWRVVLRYILFIGMLF